MEKYQEHTVTELRTAKASLEKYGRSVVKWLDTCFFDLDKPGLEVELQGGFLASVREVFSELLYKLIETRQTTLQGYVAYTQELNDLMALYKSSEEQAASLQQSVLDLQSHLGQQETLSSGLAEYKAEADHAILELRDRLIDTAEDLNATEEKLQAISAEQQALLDTASHQMTSLGVEVHTSDLRATFDSVLRCFEMHKEKLASRDLDFKTLQYHVKDLELRTLDREKEVDQIKAEYCSRVTEMNVQIERLTSVVKTNESASQEVVDRFHHCQQQLEYAKEETEELKFEAQRLGSKARSLEELGETCIQALSVSLRRQCELQFQRNLFAGLYLQTYAELKPWTAPKPAVFSFRKAVVAVLAVNRLRRLHSSLQKTKALLFNGAPIALSSGEVNLEPLPYTADKTELVYTLLLRSETSVIDNDFKLVKGLCRGLEQLTRPDCTSKLLKVVTDKHEEVHRSSKQLLKATEENRRLGALLNEALTTLEQSKDRRVSSQLGEDEELQSARQEIKEYQRLLSELRQATAEMQRNSELLVDRQTSLLTDVKAANENAASVTEENKQIRRHLETEHKKRKAADHQSDMLGLRLKHMESQYISLSDSLEQVKEEYSGLKDHCRSIRRRYEKVCRELDKAPR
jgi:chromosome segregation ATPase